MSKEWELIQTIARMDEQDRHDAFGTCYLDDAIRERSFSEVATLYGQFLVAKYGTYVKAKS